MVNDFIIGTGDYSFLAQRIIFEANVQRYSSNEQTVFINAILFKLAEGFTLEDAILQAKVKVILHTPKQQEEPPIEIAQLDKLFKRLAITLTITFIIWACFI